MSLWKRFKNILGSRSEEEEKQEARQEIVTFQQKEPMDVKFTRQFIAGGGHFFYCENEQEALQFLNEIVLNEEIKEVSCFDSHLKTYLDRLGIRVNNELSPLPHFAFIGCEYLLAFDGQIMLSSHQIKNRKHHNLPENIIVYARPHQFVANSSEALQKLRREKQGNLPSNITSIRGKNLHNMNVSQHSKNIYLLLVEVTP